MLVQGRDAWTYSSVTKCPSHSSSNSIKRDPSQRPTYWKRPAAIFSVEIAGEERCSSRTPNSSMRRIDQRIGNTKSLLRFLNRVQYCQIMGRHSAHVRVSSDDQQMLEYVKAWDTAPVNVRYLNAPSGGCTARELAQPSSVRSATWPKRRSGASKLFRSDAPPPVA